MDPALLWPKLKHELDCWTDRGLTATFWVRDDDAWTVSDQLNQLCAIATGHQLNVGLAVVPSKLEARLVDFLGIEATQFHPMCHGWRHENYGSREQPAEFGADRPFSDLRRDGILAIEAFRRNFPGVPTVFVPPFGRITSQMVSALPELGFIGVSRGPRALERRVAAALSRFGWLPSVKLGARETVAHFDVQIDPIDWGQMTSRSIESIDIELVGHLRLRRRGFVPVDAPIGILTHHLVHNHEIWSCCEGLFGVLRSHRSAVFANVARVIASSSRTTSSRTR